MRRREKGSCQEGKRLEEMEKMEEKGLPIMEKI